MLNDAYACVHCYSAHYKRIQKASKTRTSGIEPVLWLKETLSMDSVNSGEAGLLDKKGRNIAEWDTFRDV